MKARYFAFIGLAAIALVVLVISRVQPWPAQAQQANANRSVAAPAPVDNSTSGIISAVQMSPANGPDNGITYVRIGGSGFVDAAQVALSRAGVDYPLKDVSVSDSTQILAEVPDGLPAGTYDLVISQSDGSSGRLRNMFTVQSPAPLPKIVQPAQGSPAAGTEVNVDGFNFRDGSTIELSKDGVTTPLTSITRVNATRLQAVVPAGLQPGIYDVVVRTPSVETPGVVARGFTVQAP